jgi:hypothetical protein
VFPIGHRRSLINGFIAATWPKASATPLKRNFSTDTILPHRTEVKNMKHVVAILALTLLSLTPLAMGTQSREDAAQAAASTWLKLIDAGRYDDSWDAASVLFRQTVPKAQWQSAALNARGPLGALKSRTLKSATFKTALPGAPDGEYVIVQFASSFQNKASAIETVTPMKDPDGMWRVSGYYIR